MSSFAEEIMPQGSSKAPSVTCVTHAAELVS
jgi:hypothetical protein